ncbi:CATRA system-associated protein [Actinocrispum wychmicini]|uniref:CATRA-Associated Small Protein domain-containing protein n=1 Tax=Actinocrispum wychmicini TaxID=1213861 RepID=A0A4R2JKZ7_9PSEU|nr:CATRA system-associated protein [Actinocrispum wychmicini]TCO59232.1 hypothetical protein EV192_10473 [Actinocrispum wychmicini]
MVTDFEVARQQALMALGWLREQRHTEAEWGEVATTLDDYDVALVNRNADDLLRVAHSFDLLARRVKTTNGQDPDDGRTEMPASLRDRANDRLDWPPPDRPVSGADDQRG